VSHPTLHLLAALCLAGSAASIGHAQNTASVPASAQSPQASASSPPVAAAAPPAAKKVWTNDDLGDLRDHSVISTFSAASGKTAKSGDKSGTPSRNRDAKWYHDQIAKLEAQIPPLDSQIADLQAALDGIPTGDSKTSKRPNGVKGGDWRLEMADLQAKREDVVTRISALQDEARHRGIPAEALPE
jgi:hypothetical protein